MTSVCLSACYHLSCHVQVTDHTRPLNLSRTTISSRVQTTPPSIQDSIPRHARVVPRGALRERGFCWSNIWQSYLMHVVSAGAWLSRRVAASYANAKLSGKLRLSGMHGVPGCEESATPDQRCGGTIASSCSQPQVGGCPTAVRSGLRPGIFNSWIYAFWIRMKLLIKDFPAVLDGQRRHGADELAELARHGVCKPESSRQKACENFTCCEFAAVIALW